MTSAVLDPWIGLARQWQPLLAGMLAVLAAVILAAGMIRSARIRAAGSRDDGESPSTQDMRTPAPPALKDDIGFNAVNADLEKLRSILRSALSTLASTDVDEQTARSHCIRIGAFQWKQFFLPANADKRLRETYATFLNQFELLEMVLAKEWAPMEVSAILIQLNASARALSTILRQLEPDGAQALYGQNHV